MNQEDTLGIHEKLKEDSFTLDDLYALWFIRRRHVSAAQRLQDTAYALLARLRETICERDALLRERENYFRNINSGAS